MDTWQPVSVARISYKAARCGWLPMQIVSRGPTCRFRPNTSGFPHGERISPSSYLHRIQPLPGSFHHTPLGSASLGRGCAEPGLMPRPWGRVAHPLLSVCQSHLVPGGGSCPKGKYLHSVFVPIYLIMEINALHECMDVLSTTRSKIYISKANMLIKTITKYVKIRRGEERKLKTMHQGICA